MISGLALIIGLAAIAACYFIESVYGLRIISGHRLKAALTKPIHFELAARSDRCSGCGCHPPTQAHHPECETQTPKPKDVKK